MPSDSTVRADSVDVEQIMGRIRARIREKRGVDCTEDEIRELANVKIEGFLDPTRAGSDLLDHYLKGRKAAEPAPAPGLGGKLPGGTRLLVSRLLGPFRKLNSIRHAVREQRLNLVLIHNVVVELTRLTVEVRSLKMRVESLSSRLDFNERRARALENVVQSRPGAAPGAEPARSAGAPPAKSPGALPPTRSAGAGAPPEGRREPGQADGQTTGEAQRRRRRRRRGRGDASGTGRLALESGSPDGVESGPAATPPEPTPAAVPNRDTPDQ
ncbi:MAG: hypothetical protein NTV05_13125 [Acidobacteria bacterium]|nr:hypothetical protein [Acidobacteriota bacterium]